MSTHPGPADLPGAPGEPVQLNVVLNHHPSTPQFMALAGSLVHHGKLSAEEREFIVGTVIGVWPSPYVERGHRPISRAVGLPAAEFELALTGAPAQLRALSPRKQLLYGAVVELLETADLEPETLAALLDAGDLAEVVEVIYLVHLYLFIACITRVFRLEPEPDALECSERG